MTGFRILEDCGGQESVPDLVCQHRQQRAVGTVRNGFQGVVRVCGDWPHVHEGPRPPWRTEVRTRVKDGLAYPRDLVAHCVGMRQRKLARLQADVVEQDHRVVGVVLGAEELVKCGELVDRCGRGEDFGQDSGLVDRARCRCAPIDRQGGARHVSREHPDDRRGQVDIAVAELDRVVRA